jgi:hypothetical protein
MLLDSLMINVFVQVPDLDLTLGDISMDGVGRSDRLSANPLHLERAMTQTAGRSPHTA